jgi:hypothetical protein
MSWSTMQVASSLKTFQMIRVDSGKKERSISDSLNHANCPE